MVRDVLGLDWIGSGGVDGIYCMIRGGCLFFLWGRAGGDGVMYNGYDLGVVVLTVWGSRNEGAALVWIWGFFWVMMDGVGFPFGDGSVRFYVC